MSSVSSLSPLSKLSQENRYLLPQKKQSSKTINRSSIEMTPDEIKRFNQKNFQKDNLSNFHNLNLLKQLVNNECVNHGDGNGTEYKNINLIENFLKEHLNGYSGVTIQRLDLENKNRPALFVHLDYRYRSVVGIVVPDEENGGDYGAKLALEKMKKEYPYFISKQDTLVVHFHVDVVPATKESWIKNPDTEERNPFNAFIKDNKIYGRGTMDMLSFGSEFLCAFIEFIQDISSKGQHQPDAKKIDYVKGNNICQRGVDNLTDFTTNRNPNLVVVGEPPFDGCALSGEKGKINLTSLSKNQDVISVPPTYNHAIISLKNCGSCGHGAIIQNPDNPVYAASLFANLCSENIIISNVKSSKENENSPNLIAKEVALEIFYPDSANIKSLCKKIESKTNIKPIINIKDNSIILNNGINVANFTSSLNDIYIISTHAHEPHITQDNWDAYVDGMELPSFLKLIPHTWIDFLNRNISSYIPKLKLLLDFTMDTIKPLTVTTTKPSNEDLSDNVLSATYDYRPIYGSITTDVLETLKNETNISKFEHSVQRYAFEPIYEKSSDCYGRNLMDQTYIKSALLDCRHSKKSVSPAPLPACTDLPEKPLVTAPLPACTDAFWFYDKFIELPVNLSIFTFPVGPPAKIAQGCYHHTSAEYIDIDMLQKMGNGFKILLDNFFYEYTELEREPTTTSFY